VSPLPQRRTPSHRKPAGRKVLSSWRLRLKRAIEFYDQRFAIVSSEEKSNLVHFLAAP
jgi:hypothetical protein